MKFTINLEMEAVEQAVADFLQERFRGRIEVTRVEYLDEDVQFRVTVQEHGEPAPESTRVDPQEDPGGEFVEAEDDETIEDGGPEKPRGREAAPQDPDDDDLSEVRDPEDLNEPGEESVSGPAPRVRKPEPRVSRQSMQSADAVARGGKTLAYRH